jgi:hypothetical protein
MDMVALDISKVFDTIDHIILLEKISNSSLESNVVRWLSTYLRGRTAVCIFHGAVSKVLKCHQGTPQGLVISPHIFNYFVSNFPTPADINESYADNFDQAESSPDKDTMGPKLTSNLVSVSKWAKDNNSIVAPEKSYVTFFTPWNREMNYHPQAFINGTLTPLNKNPKNLGLNFHSLGIFSPHADINADKGTSRLQIMKAIRGHGWGDKETLRLTYLDLVKPVLKNAATLCFASVGPEPTY